MSDTGTSTPSPSDDKVKNTIPAFLTERARLSQRKRHSAPIKEQEVNNKENKALKKNKEAEDLPEQPSSEPIVVVEEQHPPKRAKPAPTTTPASNKKAPAPLATLQLPPSKTANSSDPVIAGQFDFMQSELYKLSTDIENLPNIMSLIFKEQDLTTSWTNNTKNIAAAFNAAQKQLKQLTAASLGQTFTMNSLFDNCRRTYSEAQAIPAGWKSELQRLNDSLGKLLDVVNNNTASIQKIAGFVQCLPGSTSAYGHRGSNNKNMDNERRAPPPKYCVLCDSTEHHPTSCPHYPTAEERIRKAILMSICLKCAKKFEDPDKLGKHKGCAKNNISCKYCENYQDASATNHHHMFCQFKNKQEATKPQRGWNSSRLRGGFPAPKRGFNHPRLG